MSRTHGESRTELHNRWKGMRYRCYCAATKNFHLWGGRGIAVCAAWRDSYEAFRDWARANGYAPGLSLDRIDPDKGYSPENCRWIPRGDQNRNTRRNRFVEVNGERMIVSDLARAAGLSRYVVGKRLRAGWSVEDAINTPVRPKAPARNQRRSA